MGSLVGMSDISNVPSFVAIHELSKTYKKKDGSRIISDYEFNYRDEFFAESFAKYYTSPETRKKLKKDFPEVYRFLAVLEKDAATGLLDYLKNFDSRSNEPHGIKHQEGDTPQGGCIVH